MYVLELSVLITIFFSVAGLIAALAAAVVVADKLGGAWYHSEPTARCDRCTGIGRRVKRSRDCRVGARRKH
jgi:hypothetical protein